MGPGGKKKCWNYNLLQHLVGICCCSKGSKFTFIFFAFSKQRNVYVLCKHYSDNVFQSISKSFLSEYDKATIKFFFCKHFFERLKKFVYSNMFSNVNFRLEPKSTLILRMYLKCLFCNCQSQIFIIWNNVHLYSILFWNVEYMKCWLFKLLIIWNIDNMKYSYGVPTSKILTSKIHKY